MRRAVKQVVAPAAILALLLLAAFGCGGSSSASATAEEFLQAGKDKNCEKMIELMDLSTLPQGINKDELVQSCKSESALGDVTGYKIVEESVDGDKAVVKVEVTAKSEGKEETESDTFILYKREGVWKISLE